MKQNLKAEQSKENTTATDLRELYNKIERETVSRTARRAGKKYSAGDIRLSIREIFKELELDEVRMTTVRGLLMSQEQFKDLRYQEVRSVVLSKKFEYDLVMVDEISTVVKR